MTDLVYISITGLQLRRMWHAPIFWRHAFSSMTQAQRANGCLGASARTINGIHHTRSIWRDRDAMLAFLHTGAHLKAVKAFRTIATGKTLGFTAMEIPNWDEVHELWLSEGRLV